MRVFLLGFLISFSFSIQAHSEDQSVEAFIDGLQPVYSVLARDLDSLNKAMISFHGELLEADKAKLKLTLSLSEQQVSDLKKFGFKVSANPHWKKQWLQRFLVESRNAKNTKSGIAGYACYPTVEETYSKAEMLVDDYSNLASWVDIGDSWDKTAGQGGFDLRVLKITNQSIGKTKPILFIHSAMHAREYTTAALTLSFAEQLLSGYENTADIQWIIDNHEVHILFIMNPDGRKKAEQGLLWRKNTNQNYCGAASNNRGADLNRNFSMFWNTTANGSSGNECDSTYRGPSKASEPETQAVEAYVKSIFPDQRGPGDSDAAPAFVKGMHLDIHSFSELVLWPWGHTDTEAPNAEQLRTLGHKFAFWNDYNPTQSVGLYPTDGTSDDISYGELGIPHFTFELGTAFFQDCATYENTIKPNNLPALMYAAKVVEAPYRLPFGPEVYGVTLNGTTNAQVTAGEAVTVSGIADDGRYKDANSVVIPRQNISSVSYFIDQLPWAQGANSNDLIAADGSFDAVSETFSGTINTAGLPEGRHLVYFQAEDADGNKGAPYAAYLSVGVNQAPTADFSVDCQGLSCTFDGSSSTDDGSISSYNWDIAGVNETGESITYTFDAEENYSVTLRVTDNAGASAQANKMVDTNANPTASFTVSCSELQCSFDAGASTDLVGDISQYNWEFGDSSQATGVTASHNYSRAGNFTVTLTVTDDEGSQSETSRRVTISQATPENNSGGGGGGGSTNLWMIALLLVVMRFRVKLIK